MDLEDRWFEDFFNAIYQSVWILDEHGKVIKANQSAQKLTGLTQEAVIGVPLGSAPWPGLTRQDKRALKWALNRAVEGRFAFRDLEFRQRGLPASILNVSFKPFLLQDGNLKFIIVEGKDITADKHASEALNQSEARFKTIFEEAGIGILIKDINGKMLDCNPAFQSMLGYTVEEILRLEYLDITHPLDKKLSRKMFDELVNGKRTSYMSEKRYLHKEGQSIWARVVASPVLQFDQQAQFVIAMVENINTRKEIESDLAEMQQRLMRGREMERLRVAQELHDGPLQEIIGATYQVKALEESISGDAEREQIQALLMTLNQLTKSVRTICGELRPPTLVPFGLEKTIKSHAEQFQAAHPELDIRLDLAQDHLVLSEQVRIALFRIYQEALNNIFRHAQASLITVRFLLENEQAVLEIKDNGKGFELPGRWINLARQGHLGIAGAMERAKDVGGNMEVISKPGKGTLIRAVVPVNEEPTQFSN